MKLPLYNKEGKKLGDAELPEVIAATAWKPDLVHQVVVAMHANARGGNAKTKDRAEVRGGGKKPWKQKGTGRARHGSIRSPLWSGGGATHAPTGEKVWTQKLTKQMKTTALYSVLARKASEGEIVVLDDMSFTDGKTKSVATTLSKLYKSASLEGRINCLILTDKADAATRRAMRNIAGVVSSDAKDLNTVSALESKHIVIAESALHGLI